MPIFKTLIMITSALILSFLLIGCGMLPSPGAEPEESETAEEGAVPEWLLSEHRTAEREDEEPLKPKDPEEDDEADEVDEDETAEPEPTQEAAEPEPAEEPAPQEEATDDHVVEAETDEPEEGEEEEPEPEHVTDQRWQRGNYTGKWLDGQPHGEGTYTHPSGGKLTGNWVEGTPDGEFTKTAPDGSTETVRFEQGQVAEDVDDGEERESWWETGDGSSGGWF